MDNIIIPMIGPPSEECHFRNRPASWWSSSSSQNSMLRALINVSISNSTATTNAWPTVLCAACRSANSHSRIATNSASPAKSRSDNRIRDSREIDSTDRTTTIRGSRITRRYRFICIYSEIKTSSTVDGCCRSPIASPKRLSETPSCTILWKRR